MSKQINRNNGLISSPCVFRSNRRRRRLGVIAEIELSCGNRLKKRNAYWRDESEYRTLIKYKWRSLNALKLHFFISLSVGCSTALKCDKHCWLINDIRLNTNRASSKYGRGSALGKFSRHHKALIENGGESIIIETRNAQCHYQRYSCGEMLQWPRKTIELAIKREMTQTGSEWRHRIEGEIS